MELMFAISWMLILAAGESVAEDSSQVHVISCKSITTSSGHTIPLVVKWVSQMAGSNHGNLEHFECPTSHKICTIPSCLESPCKKECTCLETDDSYQCMCPDGFVDDRFEGIPRTCTELNVMQNGTYLIDPDGPNGNLFDQVEVECRDGKTIVSHNVIGEQIVPQGHEGHGSYRKEVAYTLPMDTIIAIMNNSRTCRQYVRATCYDTHIYDDGGEQTAYWVSRQGYIMPNWGDAPSDVRGCLCGVYQNCSFGPEAPCNCYRSPHKWLTDDGYLRDVTRLPVSRLHFGDTGKADELMRYELGFLECE